MARTLEVFLPVSIGKKRKARRDVLSSMGKFPPVPRRWILFLRASYFRSRYNKVPPFNKTSSHEFPATCEDVNIEGWRVARSEKSTLYRIGEKRRGYLVPAQKTLENSSLCEKLRTAGRVGLSLFPRDDWNI